MFASRIFALASAAVLVASPVAAQVAQSGAAPAYPLPSPPPAAYSGPAAPAAAYALPPPPPAAYSGPAAPAPQPVDPGYVPVDPGYLPPAAPNAPAPSAPAPAPGPSAAVQPCVQRTATRQQGAQAGIPQDDVVGAAEKVFGKGAQGLAGLVEKIFKDRGQPNAYIAGREAGGAFVVGLRYGSGTMCHQIEGDRKVYWTGPSVGLDFGADANKVFVLVYNLHDSQELFRRYPNAEGRAYLVGGFTASVLQRDDVILVPIRLGVGVRLGVNGGYMNFSKKSRWLPF